MFATRTRGGRSGSGLASQSLASEILEAARRRRPSLCPAAAVEVYSGRTTSASVRDVPAMFGTVAGMKFKPGSYEKNQKL